MSPLIHKPEHVTQAGTHVVCFQCGLERIADLQVQIERSTQENKEAYRALRDSPDAVQVLAALKKRDQAHRQLAALVEEISAVDAIPAATQEIVAKLEPEDGVGWKWRLRQDEERGLVLERHQKGRRLPHWEWVADLHAYHDGMERAEKLAEALENYLAHVEESHYRDMWAPGRRCTDCAEKENQVRVALREWEGK